MLFWQQFRPLKNRKRLSRLTLHRVSFLLHSLLPSSLFQAQPWERQRLGPSHREQTWASWTLMRPAPTSIHMGRSTSLSLSFCFSPLRLSSNTDGGSTQSVLRHNGGPTYLGDRIVPHCRVLQSELDRTPSSNPDIPRKPVGVLGAAQHRHKRRLGSTCNRPAIGERYEPEKVSGQYNSQSPRRRPSDKIGN